MVSPRVFLVAAVLLVAASVSGCDHVAVVGAVDGEVTGTPAQTQTPGQTPAPTPGQTPEPPARCPAPAVPAAVPAPAGRIVVTSGERQTIAGWGASVVTDTYIDPLVDPTTMTAKQVEAMDRALFVDARINLVRVFGPGFGQAKANGAPNSFAARR